MMVRQGHQGVIEQIRHFTRNVIGVIVFTGHHHFRRFFANFFEDFVIAACQQLAGVRLWGGMLLAIANHRKHLGKVEP